MTAFAAAAAILFADPNRSVTGTLRPAVGGSWPGRVLYSRPDPDMDLGGVGAKHRGHRIDWMPVSTTAPLPVKRDQVDIDAGTFEVVSVDHAPLEHWTVLDVTPV